MEFSQLLRAARQFERVFAQRISPVLERCGLTIGEMRVLLFLANNPGCDTARDMVMVRGLGKSQVSQAVQARCGRALIEGLTPEETETLRVILEKIVANSARMAGEEQKL